MKQKSIKHFVQEIRHGQKTLVGARKDIEDNIGHLVKSVNAIIAERCKERFHDPKLVFKEINSLWFEGGCHCLDWKYGPLAIELEYDSEKVWIHKGKWRKYFWEPNMKFDAPTRLVDTEVPIKIKDIKQFMHELSVLVGTEVYVDAYDETLVDKLNAAQDYIDRGEECD